MLMTSVRKRFLEKYEMYPIQLTNSHKHREINPHIKAIFIGKSVIIN